MGGFAPEQLFCARVPLQTELASDGRVNSNARRVAAKPALHPLVTGHFAGLTADEVIARLEGARIANAHVNTMQDMWAHPQLQARGRWVDVATPTGACRRCFRPACPTASTPAWTRWPRLGNALAHCGRNWASRRPRSTA